MTIFDYYDNRIPDYYKGMYLDGYSPAEILYACKRGMLEQREEEQIASEIKITSEVRVK